MDIRALCSQAVIRVRVTIAAEYILLDGYEMMKVELEVKIWGGGGEGRGEGPCLEKKGRKAECPRWSNQQCSEEPRLCGVLED